MGKSGLIGLAITTKNREKAFSMCHDKHLEFQPENSRIFVVDDGSEDVYVDADYRYNESVGISTAKNRCLQLMYEAGCSTFWLFDDDAYPLCNDWHLPYLETGIHHLCRTFYAHHRVYDNTKTHLLGNGIAMMYSKHCIDTVGGFDTRYKNKLEHVCLSRRIHNAGLTPYQFVDVIGSDKLIYSMDEHKEIERSLSKKEMNERIKDGYDYFRSKATSKEYIEFRT